MNTTTIDKTSQVMDIFTTRYKAINSDVRLAIITAVLDNPQHHDSFIRFIEFADRQGLDSSQVSTTLAHDIGGLIRKESGFLLRVSHY